MNSILNILSTLALASSLVTGEPSAGVQAKSQVANVGVQQIKEGNAYEGLVKLEKLENKKVVWPHVLVEDPAPAPKPVVKPVVKPIVHTAVVQPVVQHPVVTVVSTAYTAHCSEGCTGRTATGINLDADPNIKLIAVDPSVIPLGKRVYVEGYGYAITGDTGGAIHGNRIDIYMAREQDALNWGVKTIKVTILD